MWAKNDVCVGAANYVKHCGAEYDATSWSARTWMGYAAQRVSCELARAVAWELAAAMGLSRARDGRDDE